MNFDSTKLMTPTCSFPVFSRFSVPFGATFCVSKIRDVGLGAVSDTSATRFSAELPRLIALREVSTAKAVGCEGGERGCAEEGLLGITGGLLLNRSTGLPVSETCFLSSVT